MNFSNFAQTDMLAQLLIEKGMLTRREFLAKIAQERGNIETDAESNAALGGGSNGRSTC